VIPPAFLFFLSIIFAIQGILCFHINFRLDFSTSVKNDIVILMGIEFSLQIAYGSIGIFALILPIHEHGRAFYLWVSSLISFLGQTYTSKPMFLMLDPRVYINTFLLGYPAPC
jgi:hypothetical protein